MAAIIKLSQNEWVKVFCANGGNQSWQVWVSLKGKTKMAESRITEFKMEEFKMAAIIKLIRMNDFGSDWISWSQKFEENGWIQDGRIQDGRIQYGCHHQVKWEWMSLSQIELVWVRVRVERECFWVNLREDNKVSESKMAVSESNMAQFKMAAIIKLSQNEQVEVFRAKWLNPIWQSSRWIQNLRLLPSSCWLRMKE